MPPRPSVPAQARAQTRSLQQGGLPLPVGWRGPRQMVHPPSLLRPRPLSCRRHRRPLQRRHQPGPSRRPSPASSNAPSTAGALRRRACRTRRIRWQSEQPRGRRQPCQGQGQLQRARPLGMRGRTLARRGAVRSSWLGCRRAGSRSSTPVTGVCSTSKWRLPGRSGNFQHSARAFSCFSRCAFPRLGGIPGIWIASHRMSTCGPLARHCAQFDPPALGSV